MDDPFAAAPAMEPNPMDDPFAATPPAAAVDSTMGEDPFAQPPVAGAMDGLNSGEGTVPMVDGAAEISSNGANGYAYDMEPLQNDGMVEDVEDDGALDVGMFSAGGGNLALNTSIYQAWESENRQALAEKTVKEAETKSRVREEAESEFTSFYEEYNKKIEARKQQNRDNEEHTRSVIYAGLESGGWASIVDVFCDVKKTNSKDTTRFKELILRKKAKENQEGTAPATEEPSF